MLSNAISSLFSLQDIGINIADAYPAAQGNRNDKKTAGQKPDGKMKSPSGAKPEGRKSVGTLHKKFLRRKAGDFHMCYVNYPEYTSIFSKRLAQPLPSALASLCEFMGARA